MRLRLTAGLLFLPAFLAAQGEHDHAAATTLTGGGTFPAGWSVRPDDGGKPTELKVESMGPGWHITTATSAIIYRAADQAAGSYQVEAKLHLFPEAAGHREAYGLFVGGSDLQGAGQRYTYFLLRGDGTFKVKRRAGSTAPDVSTGWTVHPAIVKGKADGSVANLLSVVVGGGNVSFRVNGQEVYSAKAGSVDTDGVFGLRVNHNLSVHVESLGAKKS